MQAPIYLTIAEFKRSTTYRRWRAVDAQLAAAIEAGDLETEQRLSPEWAALDLIVQDVYAALA
jgi:hypothetical protein